MIRAVIFDIGGVLAYDVWEHILLDRETGIASTFDLNADEVRKVGRDLWEQFAHRPVDTETAWTRLEKEYWNLFIERFDIPKSAIYFTGLTDRFIRPVEGMMQLLAHLHARGVKLAICSNNTEFWFRRQADKLDFHRFFEPRCIVLSSRIGVSKSSPRFEMFEAVVAAVNTDKQDCVFVDDRKEAILQGLEFGLAGIIFPSHSRQGANYLRLLLEKMGIS